MIFFLLLDDIYRFLADLRVTASAHVLLINKDGAVMVPRHAGELQDAVSKDEIVFIAPSNLPDGPLRDASNMRPLKNAPFRPISASDSKFNPRNIQYILKVNFFVFLAEDIFKEQFRSPAVFSGERKRN